MKVVINKCNTGQLIKQARIQKGLSIEAVVGELKYKRYIFIEKGKQIPNVLQLLKLSDLFNVKMADLISYKIED